MLCVSIYIWWCPLLFPCWRMHTHSPENYMKTGYPLGMVLYNKFWITRETPTRILPNLAHLLMLCVFTSVLCGVKLIKKWRKITTTTKTQIQSWPFIYKHRQQSKGEKNIQNYEPNEFDRMRVKQFLFETVAMHP